MSPEPLFCSLLSSGADLVRRKLIGVDIKSHSHHQDKINQQKILLSRLERRALRSLKLVEKVESIGLENIITASSDASDTSRGIIDRSNSPLKNLRRLQNNSDNIVNELHFDRKHVKGIVFDHKDSRDESNDDAGLIMRDLSSENTKSSNKLLLSKENTSESDQLVSNTVASPLVIDTRLKVMHRQKSRRQLKNGLTMKQRSDLGTIGSDVNIRNDLGKVVSNVSNASAKSTSNKTEEQLPVPQSMTQAFVGSVSSLIFGRKGGWL